MPTDTADRPAWTAPRQPRPSGPPRLSRLSAGLLLAALLAGCGVPADAPTTAPEPEVEVTTAPEPAPAPPRSRTDRPLADAAPADPVVRPGVVARIANHLDVLATPDASAEVIRVVEPTTGFGSVTVLAVREVGTGTAAGWVLVELPGRPVGETGWVRADAVELREVDVEVTVELEARLLTVRRNGEVVLTSPVAIGDPDHPTPTGTFWVTDKLDTDDPDGPYGPFALGLSVRSEVLTEFAGGDGQIGIHGTNAPDSIGRAVSHGCVRVANTVVRELASLLPLGTPVVIS
jgi:lipoprotein-anchoring transpeptidase ErfK/SrfK